MEFNSILRMEDENILNKATIFIVFIIIYFFLFLGCINNDNSKNQKEHNLDITIKNNENFNTSIILIINNSENLEIFNQTINVTSNEYLTYNDLTNKKGFYSVIVIHNNITYENKEIQVGDGFSNVKIYISQDNVKISQLIK